MPFEIPIPTLTQLVFLVIALFTAFCGLMVVLSRNLFHNALFLVGALFGVAANYVLLEAEFLAVSQVLVYIGAIATLIAFAIMLTRGMMYGRTSPMNHVSGKAALGALVFFLALLSFVRTVPWPADAQSVNANEGMIASLGNLFATTYVTAFEVVGLLLLVALVGAVMLARDQ
jgi:NADH-quinone oxidoreductase subunit J